MTTAGQHTEELLPCRKCGSTDLELWDGKGTQAEMSCNNCGDSDGLQVSDLLEYKHRYSGNCDFSMETLSYPPHVVELAQAHLTIEWNKRTGSGQPPKPFQSRVKPWMDACFGPTISADKVERNHRFLEEALELVQACGATREECYQLVDYVYGRPDGDVNQEVGGVMITLAALCLGNGFDMHAAGETELVRVWGKIEQIRAKQAGKPKHSPLPQSVARTESGLVNALEIALNLDDGRRR